MTGQRANRLACGDAAGTTAGYQRHRRAGNDPCADCGEAWRRYHRRRNRRRCGTVGGYQRHQRQGERPCEACLRAHNRNERRRAKRRQIEPGTPAAGECGTEAGHRRHRLKGEQPCDACMKARASAARRRRRIQKGQDPDAPVGTVRTHQDCGTYGGAAWHRRQGEPVCGACAEAAREYSRRWRRRKQIDREINRLLNGGWADRAVPARVVEAIAAYPVFDREGGCGGPEGVDLGCGCRACRVLKTADRRQAKESSPA